MDKKIIKRIVLLVIFILLTLFVGIIIFFQNSEYGRKLYLELSKRLTKKMGKGYSRSNLYNMRNFYITYPIVQTSGQ